MNSIRARRFGETIITPKILNLTGFYDISSRVRDIPNPKKVVFDLSLVTKVYADCLFPLGAVLAKLRDKNALNEIVFPKNRYLMDFLRKSGWSDYLNGKEPQISPKGQNTLPVQTFHDHKQLNDKLNSVFDTCLSAIEFKGKTFTLFEWSLNEITGNILDHSKTDTGHVQVTIHPSRHRLTITVYDSGIGTPSSMRERPENKEQFSDLALIQSALTKGVTSKPTTNQGLGLAGALAITKCSGGMFTIASESAFHRENEQNTEQDEGAYWHLPGTLVDLQIGTDRRLEVMPIGLHDPAYSMVEEFQQNDSSLILKVADHFKTLGNRTSGKQMFTLTTNLLNSNPEATLKIDFDETSTISSSCADEFIGNLVITLGGDFSRKIVFENLNSTSISIVAEILKIRTGRATPIPVSTML